MREFLQLPDRSLKVVEQLFEKAKTALRTLVPEMVASGDESAPRGCVLKYAGFPAVEFHE